MISKSITISIPSGLEARPVALLVQVASRFDSKITIESGDKTVNAKSIMGMMSLNVGNGDQIVVVTDGTDEAAAAQEIEMYLSNQ